MTENLFGLYLLLCVICIILFGVFTYAAIENFGECFDGNYYKKSHLCKAILQFIYSGVCIYIFINLFNHFKQFI